MSEKEIDYYSVLNVSQNSTQEEIALAYRKFAIAIHPNRDKTIQNKFIMPKLLAESSTLSSLPSSVQWEYINKAYDILSDPLRREVYDRYGEEALEKGVPLPNGYFEPYKYHNDTMKTYRDVFGSYSPFANLIDAAIDPPPIFKTDLGYRVKQKDPNVEKLIYLELKEVYFGALKRMIIMRHEFVDETKTETETREKILFVKIPRGILPGTRIVFKEEGDRGPNKIPADIIFIVADKVDKYFSRDGSDIHMTYCVSLERALCGFYMNIQTIDDRQLSVGVYEVVHPEYVRILPDEGLPDADDPNKFGNLCIHFKIKFPQYIDDNLIPKIRDLFNQISVHQMALKDEFLECCTN